MNKINIVNNELKLISVDEKIEYNFEINDKYGINTLDLTIKENTDIELDIDRSEERR